MVQPSLDSSRRWSTPRFEVQKTFDIRARHALELELRLDKFRQALGARGGRVLGVSRLHAAGDYSACVGYWLPTLAK
jgi:hypothetical protein